MMMAVDNKKGNLPSVLKRGLRESSLSPLPLASLGNFISQHWPSVTYRIRIKLVKREWVDDSTSITVIMGGIHIKDTLSQESNPSLERMGKYWTEKT
jgi:hypothetical protein